MAGNRQILGPMIDGLVTPRASRTRGTNTLAKRFADADPFLNAGATFEFTAPVTSPKSASTTTRRRPSGGGAAGGGGGGGAAAAPAAPPAEGGGELASVGGLSADQIEAAISFIESQFGQSIAEIAAAGGEAGRVAQNLLAELQRQKRNAVEAQISQLLSRGFLRSGIAARDRARLQEQVAAREAEINSRLQSTLADLARRAEQVKAQTELEKASTISSIESSNIESGTAAALQGRLNEIDLSELDRVINDLVGARS